VEKAEGTVKRLTDVCADGEQTNTFIQFVIGETATFYNENGIWWPGKRERVTFYTAPGDRLEVRTELLEWQDDSPTLEMAYPHVKDFALAIDGGANVGLFTRRLARKFDTVWAFEPDPINYQCLLMNTENIKNVVTFNFALSDVAKEWNISDVKMGTWPAKRHLVEGGTGGLVRAITLDSLNPMPGFVKLDLEGHEYNALLGMPDVLEHHPVVMYEDTEKFRSRYDGGDPAELLLELGAHEVARGNHLSPLKGNLPKQRTSQLRTAKRSPSR